MLTFEDHCSRSPVVQSTEDHQQGEPVLKPTSCACVHAQSLQSCPTLCDPMDCSPRGSSVHGILQARILEWIAISFSRGSSWPRDGTRIYLLHWQVGSLPRALPGKPQLAVPQCQNAHRLHFLIHSMRKCLVLSRGSQPRGTLGISEQLLKCVAIRPRLLYSQPSVSMGSTSVSNRPWIYIVFTTIYIIFTTIYITFTLC